MLRVEYTDWDWGAAMRELDTEHAKLFLLDDGVVLVETKAGVIVDGSMVKNALDLIEEHVASDYSIIIDRKNEYKLMRFEIYGEVNSRQRLQGIAIVTHSKAADMLTDLEAPLCKKVFAKFNDFDAAVDWARDTLKNNLIFSTLWG